MFQLEGILASLWSLGNLVFMFILFGAVLDKTGVGTLLTLLRRHRFLPADPP